MPNQFVVPQFIDVEDKILGPISVRQFVIFLIGSGAIVGAYQILYKMANQVIAFIISAVGIFAAVILLAFVKVNGRPFHIFILSMFQTLKNPQMRTWNNVVNERLVYRREPPPPPPLPTKQPLREMTLAKLALLVDTGGAFHDDESDTDFWGTDLPSIAHPKKK